MKRERLDGREKLDCMKSNFFSTILLIEKKNWYSNTKFIFDIFNIKLEPMSTEAI
jgi:hypothetical protein